jgi:WD40 repeat protein
MYRQLIVFLLPVFICIMTEARGQEVETVIQTGHYGEISAVAFSTDGMLTATGSADKTVKL